MTVRKKNSRSGAAPAAEYTVRHHGLDPDHPTSLQAAAIMRLLQSTALYGQKRKTGQNEKQD